MALATEACPVRPTPLAHDPGALEIFLTARRDLLAFWPEEAFRWEFAGKKMLRRWIFIANTPDTVEHVLVTSGTGVPTSALILATD